MSPRPSPVWRVAGTVVAVLVLFAGTASALAGSVREHATDIYQLASGATAQTISVPSGDVAVRAARAGERPQMIVKTSWSFSKPQVQVAQSGGSTRIDANCNGFTNATSPCSIDVQLVVPAHVNLTVRSSNGDVSVSGISGRIDASSSNGDVRVAGCGASPVRMTTNNGDLTATCSRPPSDVTMTSDLGDVRLTVPADRTAYATSATTSLGNVSNEVGSDPTSTRRLVLHSSLGDISISR